MWDATSGEAVTPPLWHPGNFLHTAGFGPDGRRFAVPASHGVFRWELEEDTRPKEDIALHTQLLSGQRLLGSKGLVPLTDEEASRAFEALAKLYPEHFRDDTQAVAAWDRAQAEDLVWSRRWGEIVRLLDRPVASSSSRSLDLIHRGDAYAQMENWDRALGRLRGGRAAATGECRAPALGGSPSPSPRRRPSPHLDLPARPPPVGPNPQPRPRALDRLELRHSGRGHRRLRATDPRAGSSQPREAVDESGPLLDDLGLALYRAGQPAEALATLEQRIERHGPSPLAHLVLALENHRRGADDEAERHLRDAARTDLDASNWKYDMVIWQERLRVEALLKEAPM